VSGGGRHSRKTAKKLKGLDAFKLAALKVSNVVLMYFDEEGCLNQPLDTPFNPIIQRTLAKATRPDLERLLLAHIW